MKKAISLAKKATGFTSPNPLVGALIVKNGNIIGKGYHKRYATPHAEVIALANASESVEGATMYVTLEPCCHYGNTPPCTEAIIKSGISTVIVGTSDPNPKVCGKGISLLQKSGITVIQNIMQKECYDINKIFFHYIKTNTPYVTMKYAMTLDGKIATYTRASKYITSKQALHSVHLDRHVHSAIMVGVGTVLNDNPLLTCRIPNLVSPTRIICDTNLSTPLNSNVVTTATQVDTIIATCVEDKSFYTKYVENGVKIITISKYNNRLNVRELLKKLGTLGIDSILLEGGATLNWSFLEASAVQKVKAYIAPKIFGGFGALSPVAGSGVELPSFAYKIKNTSVRKLGCDYLIQGDVIYETP